MSRRDTLRTMLSRRDERLPAGNSSPVDESNSPSELPRAIPHMRAGAVGAMGRSLGQIANAAEHARSLIAAGSAVVEIAPSDLDRSFVSDRLESDGGDFDALVEAIRETGQRSPVLVRPHPTSPDRYQIVFGHRRVRVAAKLGRKVRAVVQNLTDEEVVVIQGQENSARADLSYIERGLFAVALEERGFDRRIIMAALTMEKTQLSKLLALTHSIPPALARAIGPAPKAGRPRWAALAARLAQAKGKRIVEELIAHPSFESADSNVRFLLVFAGLVRGKSSPKTPSTALKDDNGRQLARIERRKGKIVVTVNEAGVSEFGEFLVARLPLLSREFQSQQGVESTIPKDSAQATQTRSI